jgi:hypothetical protein
VPLTGNTEHGFSYLSAADHAGAALVTMAQAAKKHMQINYAQ